MFNFIKKGVSVGGGSSSSSTGDRDKAERDEKERRKREKKLRKDAKITAAGGFGMIMPGSASNEELRLDEVSSCGFLLLFLLSFLNIKLIC